MKKIKALLLVALCVAMALTTAACGKKKDDGKYTIGICQLVQHPALDAATEGFKDALKDKLGEKNVEFDEQNASGDTPTCATIINNFKSAKVDLILANATAPLQAAATAINDIPILGTSITDYATALDIKDWTGVTGYNVSGTSDLAPLDKQAEAIKEVFPDAKKVGLLYCTAEPNSKYQVDTIKGYLEEIGLTTEYYGFTDTNDLQAVTQSACAGSDVIYIPTDNTAASATGIIDNVCRAEKTPVFAGEEGICKGCGVATLSISYYDLGYKTGEMAYEILKDGKDITKMNVEYAPNVTKKYNADIAKDLGITVPEGYEAITE